MPLFDYTCKKCQKEFEELVATPDDSVRCPHCNSTRVARLPALVGGYQFDSGGGSVRPKQAGSYKKKVKK